MNCTCVNTQFSVSLSLWPLDGKPALVCYFLSVSLENTRCPQEGQHHHLKRDGVWNVLGVFYRLVLTGLVSFSSSSANKDHFCWKLRWSFRDFSSCCVFWVMNQTDPAADMDEETPLLNRRPASSESKVGNIALVLNDL